MCVIPKTADLHHSTQNMDSTRHTPKANKIQLDWRQITEGTALRLPVYPADNADITTGSRSKSLAMSFTMKYKFPQINAIYKRHSHFRNPLILSFDMIYETETDQIVKEQ